MNNASYINSPVYQIWGGTSIRFGTAVAEKIGTNGWKYVRVQWEDNELYERVRPDDDGWTRANHVHIFDPGEMIQVLKKISLSHILKNLR